MQDMKEQLDKEILKKNQAEILEMKVLVEWIKLKIKYQGLKTGKCIKRKRKNK
jgi:hypothetical protein